jgi:hypothetical protein
MKMAKFLVSHFDSGIEKFKADQTYPLDEETRLCVARGAAEEVDVEDEKTDGPTREDLNGMLEKLPEALDSGKAPTDESAAISMLRATFGNLLTGDDEATVAGIYKAKADADAAEADARAKAEAEAKAKAEKEAADKASAEKAAADKQQETAGKGKK